MDDEERFRGTVGGSVYWAYLRSLGSCAFLATMFVLCVSLEASKVLSEWWLAVWAQAAGG